ncbi:MAG TPA: hypothetical protein VFX20_14800 [Steroidobacteraceae bacterium]|nr:hypothetical protein [Steroidobacteraceae bacterium]
MKLLTLCAVLAIALGFSTRAPAATNANANSPLGINLNFLSYYDPEQPFLNIFKTTGITQSTPTGWSTRSKNMNATHEEAFLQLDSDGYPATLTPSSSDPNSPQKFDRVCAVLLRLPASNAGSGLHYRAGQYVILYDGVGALSVGMDAKMASTARSASGGRDVFNVATPTRNGVWVCITQTDPKNHVRNIRVVKAEEESLLDQGNVYTPAFLGLLKNFRVIRAMQWLKIDEKVTPPGTWADRAQLTDAGWGSGKGAPLEAVIGLCNALGADCWINVPHTADDDYMTQMATLVHQQLGSTQKVYVEFSNEVWNGAYPQYHYAMNQGAALWPSAKPFQANRDWYGMRTAQMCDIWAKVWGGDDSRVHCVLSAQAAVTSTATESLNCPLWSGAPCYKHHITDVAVAPYVGWSASQYPLAWRTADPATLLNDIFKEFNAGASGGYITNTWTGFSGGALQNVSNGEVAYQKALAPYHLPLIAYEGGQSILGGPSSSDDSTLVNAYVAANRDSRMSAVYTTALENWKANGGEVYVLYDDVSSPGKYGEWGLLESFLDRVSPLSDAPPKWQAVQNFIAKNPCWWSGCGGMIATVPAAPAGFKASN